MAGSGSLRDRLATAPATVLGRFTSASNATLLVGLHDASGQPPVLDPTAGLVGLDPARFAVYKPAAGEAPLWDFPDGSLWRREVAARVVDEALGLDLVPMTIARDDLEHGPGALQAFVPHDPEEHYFHLRDRGEHDPDLRRMVVFDLLVDNADRKAGHVLLDRTGPQPRVRLIDHGVCFHAEPHLRTVAWDFAGTALRDAERDLGRRLCALLDGDEELVRTLHDLLRDDEVARLRERAAAVAVLQEFPRPQHDRQYPWPLL